VKKISKSFMLIFLISIFSIILFIPQGSSAMIPGNIFEGVDMEYHGLPCCVCPSYIIYNCYCIFM